MTSVVNVPKRWVEKLVQRNEMLNFLIDHLHLISVDYSAAWCEKRKRTSAGFNSITVSHNGRPWNIKGGSRKRLIKAIHGVTSPNPTWCWRISARMWLLVCCPIAFPML